MKISTDYQNLLDRRGISLAHLGFREIALERADALTAVEYLRAAAIPIAGGDVYFKNDDKIEFAYAGWHSDRGADEDLQFFRDRSWSAATQYIRDFPRPPKGVPLFVLVIPR